ncbi:MAG: NFACT family protein [Faecousia sp.]
MAFDAYFMTAVLGEVRHKCLGARVDKIHQPSRDTLILHLRCREGREKLLFAANPTAPRLHLTDASPENPAEPPMFCMLLRKHLLGARLTEITQPPMERLAEFTFDCTDEMGFPVQKKLVAELMGRTCNLYLLGDGGRILDCLRRIGLDESARPALPGLNYQPPEKITKLDPGVMEEQDYANLVNTPGADMLSARLMDNLGGLSPLVCREAALFAGGAVDARVTGNEGEKLYLFFREHLNHPAPWLSREAGQYAFCPLRQYGESERMESFGALLDGFYTQRSHRDIMRQKSQGLRKSVQNLVTRTKRKLAVQEKELTATYDRERLRQLGDILTANLHNIVKGQTKALCQDFYDENMAMVEIPLSPTLSPQQNAAKYYKDYARMKNAEKELNHQLALGREELAYLESVLEELNRAGSEAELEEIRQELSAGGYVRDTSARARMKQKKLPPLRFESTDGFAIYVGRNNRGNDELTFHTARKDDIWCHASKVHGAHVVISCGGRVPPDDTVTQAAQLAAYYSESGGGQNIPVDVTPVKQVKRIKSGKPGMVIYHTYRTAIVNPYPDIRVDPLNAEKADS